MGTDVAEVVEAIPPPRAIKVYNFLELVIISCPNIAGIVETSIPATSIYI